jgi:hypothetical protein
MGCLPGNTVELLQIAPLEIPYIWTLTAPIWLFELKQPKRLKLN